MAGTQIMRKDPPELSREALAEYYEETLEAFKAYGILPSVPLGSPPKMKLCIDCKWYELRTGNLMFSIVPVKTKLCMRPITSVVDGKNAPRWVECELERINPFECGPDGKYWEAK